MDAHHQILLEQLAKATIELAILETSDGFGRRAMYCRVCGQMSDDRKFNSPIPHISNCLVLKAQACLAELKEQES